MKCARKTPSKFATCSASFLEVRTHTPPRLKADDVAGSGGAGTSTSEIGHRTHRFIAQTL